MKKFFPELGLVRDLDSGRPLRARLNSLTACQSDLETPAVNKQDTGSHNKDYSMR